MDGLCVNTFDVVSLRGRQTSFLSTRIFISILISFDLSVATISMSQALPRKMAFVQLSIELHVVNSMGCGDDMKNKMKTLQKKKVPENLMPANNTSLEKWL